MSFISRKIRENNIILHKIPEESSQETDIYKVVFSIFEKLELQVPDYAVSDLHRLGKKLEGTIRPILVKFTGARWVKLIFSKKDIFKNLDISISKDRSKEDRAAWKILQEKVQKLKDLNFNPRIVRNKIIIEGKVLEELELDNLLNIDKRDQAIAITHQEEVFKTPVPLSSTQSVRGRPKGSRKNNPKSCKQLANLFKTPTSKKNNEENSQ